MTREDDSISRQAAIDAADRADYTGLAVEDVKKVTDEVVKELKRLPSAQPERKKGEWVVDDEFIDCSVCRREKWSRIPYGDLVRRFRYCPNCGAEMRGGDDE